MLYTGGKSYQGLTALNNNVTPHTMQQPTPNFLFGQPQLANSAQPQFFIAGPSPSTASGGMPYQQILIPINQPPIQQNTQGMSKSMVY